jgi:hypothetical protein
MGGGGARYVSRGARRGTPSPALAGDALGRLAEAAQELVELAPDVARRVDPLEQHLRALDDAVGQLREEPRPLVDQLVGAAAGLVDDPIGLGLRLAPNQLGFALGVAQQACCLSLCGAHDRLDALRRVPRKTSKVEAIHAPTVSPVRCRQYRMFV